jgi:hypothetical protein
MQNRTSCLRTTITEDNRMQLVLLGVQSRMLGPCLAGHT